MVGSMARWTTDEDDRDVLKVYCSFIETPDTRILKFIFEEDRVYIRFDELPDIHTAFEMIGNLSGHPSSQKEGVKDSLQRRACLLYTSRCV